MHPRVKGNRRRARLRRRCELAAAQPLARHRRRRRELSTSLGGEAKSDGDIAPAVDADAPAPAAQTRAARSRPPTCAARGEILPLQRGAGRNRIQLGAPDRAPRRHRGARGAGTIRARRTSGDGRTAAHARATRIAPAGARHRDGAQRSDGAEFALKALRATLADATGRWLFDPATRRRSRSSRSRVCVARRSSTR